MSTDYALGPHPAKSRSAVLGKAKTGTYQVGVEFEFVEGPNLGKRIAWYGFFSDAARDRTFEALRNCGFKGDDLSDLSSMAAEDVPTVQLVLDTEDYNGERRVKVKWVNRLGGPAVGERLEEQDAKSFAAQMRAHLVAADKLRASGAKPAAAPAKANGAKTPVKESVEDVPF